MNRIQSSAAGLAPPRELTMEVVTSFVRLTALEPAWRLLMENGANRSVFMTPTWLNAWWRQFGESEGRCLCVVAFFAQGELVGLAPLLRRTVRYRGVVPVRRIELLGSGEAREEEICSEYLGVLAAPEHAATVAAVLAEGLHRGELGRWDELVMPSMWEGDPFVDLFAAALERTGVVVGVEPTGSSRTIFLPASWEEYLRCLGSRHRYVVSRALRDFEAWAGPYGWELKRAGSAEDLREGRGILCSLHGERWHDRRPGGAFSNRRFLAFHEEVMERMFDGLDGRLDLLWLRVGQRPISVLYNIVYRERVSFYQSGRALDVPARIRPGIVIHALAIRRAIDEGLGEYDFLAGASQYKRQLAPASHSLVALRAVGTTSRARAVEAARARCEQVVSTTRCAGQQAVAFVNRLRAHVVGSRS